ncbi:Protein TIFY 10B [Platanthera guangdongensis]|uniref:Protein TIFY n=1 Tax=Platanthera guangdongensis TaxID=2320717 RepID=A0ABR2MNS6_9ASPA
MTSSTVTGRPSEKSSFSLTCNLLRQYIKEKGCLADLGLGPAIGYFPGSPEAYKLPTTMILLPGAEVSGEERPYLKDGVLAINPTRSMDPDSNRTPPENPQLTIFYRGKVLVFDNFPAEKAEDLMKLANKSSTMAAGSFLPLDSAAALHRPSFPAPSISPATFPPRPQPNFSGETDLPIARKASLHRFLEKRKDRISAMAPYQISASDDVKMISALTPEDISRPWLGLGTQISS